MKEKNIYVKRNFKKSNLKLKKGWLSLKPKKLKRLKRNEKRKKKIKNIEIKYAKRWNKMKHAENLKSSSTARKKI
jgi:hypothetical protein